MTFLRRKREYAVTPEHDESAAPEETLVDAGSAFSDVELPVGENIWRGAFAVSALMSLVLIVGTGRLTVQRHDFFAQMSWRNRTVDVAVPPPRGIIMDRNGVPLVQNVPSFDVLVVSRQVARTPDGIPVGIAGIAGALGKNTEEMVLAVNDGTRKNAVFFLATDITRDQVLALQNSLPAGFSIILSTKRLYTDGPQLSHVVGYVGKVSKQELAEDSYYLPSDTVGRLGVEASYENVLRGTHGQLLFGSPGQSEGSPARPGANLVLNLDLDVQKVLYSALLGVLRDAGLGQAAAIVQDPRSGAVLAMASFPSYDNNVFNGTLSQQDADLLFNNRAYPMLNRTIAGRYNPGSTIKPFIGMTALQEGIVRADQVVNHNCVNISIPNPSDPEHPYVFENWRPDTGWFDLYRAIADSCNVYFYTIGGGHNEISGLGILRIARYLAEAFADAALGIDLPGEEHGFVPTPDWKLETKNEPWYQGDTYNTSIGQGDLLVTPLWINSYISAIANGGTLWRPQIASRVVDQDKRTLLTYPSAELAKLPFSDEVIRSMQQAMRRTVTSGTARVLGDIGVSAAAKTGTAEVVKGRRVNSMVTVYAPVEDPRIALTVLIEGSSQNQGYALQAARSFLRQYFEAPETPPQATTNLPPSPSPAVASPVAL